MDKARRMSAWLAAALVLIAAPLSAEAKGVKGWVDHLPTVEGDNYGVLAMSFGAAFGVAYFLLPFMRENDAGQYAVNANPNKILRPDFKGKLTAPYTMGDLPAGKRVDFQGTLMTWKLPPGQYTLKQVYLASREETYPVPTGNFVFIWSAGQAFEQKDFAAQFSIERGKVTYLGRLTAFGRAHNCCKVTSWELVLEDKLAEDQAIAARKGVAPSWSWQPPLPQYKSPQ